MYRRDFGVLVLSVFALWWSLQHEGAYEYRKAFYYNLPKQDDLSVYHKVPSPIVVRYCHTCIHLAASYKHAVRLADLYGALYSVLLNRPYYAHKATQRLISTSLCTRTAPTARKYVLEDLGLLSLP